MRTSELCFYLATVLALSVMLGQGCGAVPPNDTASNAGRPWSDDPGPDAEQNWNDGNAFYECGTRTVNSIPGPGFVETAMPEFEVDAQPSESPLLKVLFPSLLCQQGIGRDGTTMLYEVDQAGNVISSVVLMELNGAQVYMRSDPAMDLRFTVEDECLLFGMDSTDVDLPDWYPPGTITSPCSPGQFSIDRQGMVIGEPDGEYICVEADLGDACRSCWEEDGVWHEEIEVSGTYQALGNLDNASAPAWAASCGESNTVVNIREGDRVSFNWITRTTYRLSASPEELGYEQFETAGVSDIPEMFEH